MKKLFVFAILAFLLTLSALALEPIVFRIDTQDAADNYVTKINDATYSVENGCLKIDIVGADPYVTHAMTTKAFDTEQYPFVKYRFKIVGIGENEKSAQFFFNTDKSGKMGEKGTYTYLPVAASGDWEEVLLNLSSIGDSHWKGKIENFRFDPLSGAANPAGVSVYVEYVAFFPTESSAKAFTYSDGLPTLTDNEKEVKVVKNEYVAIIPAGTIKAGDNIYSFIPSSGTINTKYGYKGGTPIVFNGGEAIALSDYDGENYVYVARGAGNYNLAFYHKNYTDIESHWGSKTINYVSDRKIFDGTSQTNFSPDMTMTREMFITVLGRMHGLDISLYSTDSGYSDVNKDEYYAPYVSWAKDCKIALPINETTFGVEEAITREDMALIIDRYIKYYNYSFPTASATVAFNDLDGIDPDKKTAIIALQALGIIDGRDSGIFDPKGISTRAEVSTIIARVIKSILGRPLNFDPILYKNYVLWKFDNQQFINEWQPSEIDTTNKTKTQITLESGAMKLVDDDDGFNMTYTIPQDKQFELKKYPFVKIKYKTSISMGKTQIYFWNDSQKGNPRADIELPGSLDEWTVQTLDFSAAAPIGMAEGFIWSGNINKFRFDPMRMYKQDNPRTFIIDYIAFFGTKEAADAFNGNPDEYTYSPYVNEKEIDLNNYKYLYFGDETVVGMLSPNCEFSIEDGTLKMTGNGSNNEMNATYIVPYGKNFNLEDYPFLKIRYKMNKKTSSRLIQLYYYTDYFENKVGNPRIQFYLTGNFGEWNEMTLDFSSISSINRIGTGTDTEWRGSLQKFRFDPQRFSGEGEDIEFFIEYIAFCSSKETAEDFTSKKLEKLDPTSYEQIKLEDIKVKQPKKDRIRFGSYTSYYYPTLNEEQVKWLSEAGIDFALVALRDIPLYMRENILNWMAKYGIEACVSDRAIEMNGGVYDQRNKSMADSYSTHPMFAGSSFVDEPGSDEFDKIGETVRNYQRDFPGKTPYINLLPMYANDAQLKYGAGAAAIEYYDPNPDTYKEHIRLYCEKVPTDYICVDIYPCKNAKGAPKGTYQDYCKSIEIVADACRTYNREFWVCIQTCSWSGGVREPDEIDLRWQAFTMLSFGAKNMLYYVYAKRTQHTGTCIDENGERSELWYASQKMTTEFKKLSDTYVSYKNVGVFNYNCTAQTPYLALETNYNFSDIITEIKCDDPLLFGCFESKENNSKAFTIVNMSDLKLNKSISARLKLAGSVVKAYVGGEPQTLVPDSSGYYIFNLACGEGLFVTLE